MLFQAIQDERVRSPLPQTLSGRTIWIPVGAAGAVLASASFDSKGGPAELGHNMRSTRPDVLGPTANNFKTLAFHSEFTPSVSESPLVSWPANAFAPNTIFDMFSELENLTSGNQVGAGEIRVEVYGAAVSGGIRDVLISNVFGGDKFPPGHEFVFRWERLEQFSLFYTIDHIGARDFVQVRSWYSRIPSDVRLDPPGVLFETANLETRNTGATLNSYDHFQLQPEQTDRLNFEIWLTNESGSVLKELLFNSFVNIRTEPGF